MCLGDKLSIIIVMAILTIQSYRRLYECLFVSVFSDKGKINLIQYIWGLTYYSLLVSMLACLLNIIHKPNFALVLLLFACTMVSSSNFLIIFQNLI